MGLLILIQSFIDNLGKFLLSIVKIILLSKWFVKVKKQKQDKDCVLLGNGPSLNNMIDSNKDFLRNKELICVNHFPVYEHYELLKPKFFMTSAPDLWLDDIDEKFVIASNKLFKAISEKTNWNLDLFIPFEAKKYNRWQLHLKSNQNVKIVYYNNVAIEGWEGFRHFFYKRNIGMPRPHNIMIPSIFNAINLGFKMVYLWGVDHSWLKDISVDDENNALINQKHFYDHDSSKAVHLDKKGIGARKLHEILHKFMLAFKGYFVLRDYADKMNVRILNQTEGSFIDAFERDKL